MTDKNRRPSVPAPLAKPTVASESETATPCGCRSVDGAASPTPASTERCLAIDRPCSACSGGDSEMEHHKHSPPFRMPMEGPDEPVSTSTPLCAECNMPERHENHDLPYGDMGTHLFKASESTPQDHAEERKVMPNAESRANRRS
jgi:hypothetical protein